jgi:hypothetical protein
MMVPAIMTPAHVGRLTYLVEEAIRQHGSSPVSLTHIEQWVSVGYRTVDREMFIEWLKKTFPDANINYVS